MRKVILLNSNSKMLVLDKYDPNNELSLPLTITDSRITSDMRCVRIQLSTPPYLIGTLSVTVSSGSVTITSSCTNKALQYCTRIYVYLTRAQGAAINYVRNDYPYYYISTTSMKKHIINNRVVFSDNSIFTMHVVCGTAFIRAEKIKFSQEALNNTWIEIAENLPAGLGKGTDQYQFIYNGALKSVALATYTDGKIYASIPSSSGLTTSSSFSFALSYPVDIKWWGDYTMFNTD